MLFLFSVAFWAERLPAHAKARWFNLPIIYTLSLSVYCTAWTFYGAVGYAARSGLEFLTIYLGPSLIMFAWWWSLRKLVRVGRSQKITSVADLISSRFGKSNTLAVLVTVLAVIGTTPYIALQLQSVTLSFAAFAKADSQVDMLGNTGSIALAVAVGLAFFTVLFGTRNLDVNERHSGVVMAIAVEAVVKLLALLAVGVFVIWGLNGGVSSSLQVIDASPIGRQPIVPARWIGLTLLAAAAFLSLPRMFQVLVVENQNEEHLLTASWAFPAYLMLMSLFVVPIAATGLKYMPAGANPDLFVLTLPLSQGHEGLALLAYLGGFSSATSMVIVAAIAVSTMVSNHIITPLWLRAGGGGAHISGDIRVVILRSRRLSITGVVLLGYLYYHFSSGTAALAAIGLVSFAGIAQVMPAMLGGLFWRGATRSGALAGVSIGALVWLYCLFLPSFGSSVLMPDQLLANGPFGISWLRPHALFGVVGFDPLIHAVFWSLLLNTGSFVIISLISFPSPVERLQGAQFVNVFDHSDAPRGWQGQTAQTEDLLIMAQRILGAPQAQALFSSAAQAQGLDGYLPDPTPDFLRQLERELSGTVGAATAHAMIGQITGGVSVSVQDLMAVADETAQMMEYSSQLERQSAELTRTATQLRAANDKLTQLSVQKDAFLSQVSHELRTPMTSIRAFSEILRDGADLPPEARAKYSSIINEEAQRLTRLLDDLLDLSVLESGTVQLNLRSGALKDVVDAATQTALAGQADLAVKVHFIPPHMKAMRLHTDLDRLGQVFINLIANARKYCDADTPQLIITAQLRGAFVQIDFADNGSGVPRDAQDMIFEKFARLSDQKAGGAGLGLAICREIVERLGGAISYVPGGQGAQFRVSLPIRAPKL